MNTNQLKVCQEFILILHISVRQKRMNNRILGHHRYGSVWLCQVDIEFIAFHHLQTSYSYDIIHRNK